MAYGVDRYPLPPERSERREVEYDENLTNRFDDDDPGPDESYSIDYDEDNYAIDPDMGDH
jgi:hypothetical protein